MSTTFQALVMGIVQGLAEFLPISSSGHLIIVPALLGWTDPFIDSLAFSVMLHMGTLVALLIYFWRDWLRLIPAGLATIRDRSFRGDPDRRLAWLIVVTVIPAAIVGTLLNDFIESNVRQAGVVAVLLVVGAAIMWLAERWGRKQREIDGLGFGAAFGIGLAQAIALFPGISRSGISISAGLFANLTREAAARFSFLMAAPVIAGAGVFEARKLVTGEAGVTVELAPLVVGFLAAMIAGLIAIWALLRYLRTNSLGIFIAYRLIAAAVVVAVLLAR
ncbi:MAG TPA: undecaprenyl-diphosphatase UppP [Candidatus Limnocylindrales bacterium]|nr:undecaprenyl-diphosphatase UppP [Candidatus Limnocylindrales bacterium]